MEQLAPPAQDAMLTHDHGIITNCAKPSATPVVRMHMIYAVNSNLACATAAEVRQSKILLWIQYETVMYKRVPATSVGTGTKNTYCMHCACYNDATNKRVYKICAGALRGSLLYTTVHALQFTACPSNTGQHQFQKASSILRGWQTNAPADHSEDNTRAYQLAMPWHIEHGQAAPFPQAVQMDATTPRLPHVTHAERPVGVQVVVVSPQLRPAG